MAVKAVSVVFQAFTDKFEGSVNRAKGSMGGFMKSLVGMAAGYISIRGAINNITEQMQKLDNYGKISDRLSIDPNTLRGLDLAATQTGTSFSAVETGINKMVKLIGEAEVGISTGTLALKELNLTANDFSGMTTEERFMKMANAIAAIDSPSQRAATAMKVFGRGGAELINILSQGEEGIKAYIAEAEKLGGGKLLREDVRQAEIFNDSVDKIGRAWEGVWQQLAINLAPSLTSIANLITDLIVPATNIMKSIWDALDDVILNIMASFEMLGAYWDNFIGNISDEELGNVLLDIEQRLQDALTMEITTNPSEPAAVSSVQAAAETFKPQNLKSFMEAAAVQSSRAFDILNPDRSATQKDIADATKRTATAVEKIAEKDGITLVKEDI